MQLEMFQQSEAERSMLSGDGGVAASSRGSVRVNHSGQSRRESPIEKMLLTPAEAAVALAIGRSKLYELLRAGAIASIRIGNCRRIPVGALEHFVAELTDLDSVGPAA